MRNKLLSAIAVLAIAGSANAADTSKWYVQADIGYGWTADAGLSNVAETGSPLLFSTLDKLEKSTSYGIAAGYNINENIRTELGVTMRNGFEVKDTDTGITPAWDFKGDIVSTALMANVYYTEPLADSCKQPII